MSDPSLPTPKAPAPLYSVFGGELGDPWAETYPDDPAYGAGRAARGYRVRSEGMWSAARDEYVAGGSAETVCERYDLGLSAFRQRARREGWRRLDAEDLSPELSPYPPEPEAAPPTGELADLAWRSAAQAIRRGRVYEARAWMKLAEALREQVKDEEKAARWAERVAAREAAALADAETADDDLDDEAGADDELGEDALGDEAGGDEAADHEPLKAAARHGEAARLHALHYEKGVQSPHWEPGCDRPPTEAECAAIIADLEADLAANPAFPGAEAMLRKIKATFKQKTGRSP